MVRELGEDSVESSGGCDIIVYLDDSTLVDNPFNECIERNFAKLEIRLLDHRCNAMYDQLFIDAGLKHSRSSGLKKNLGSN